MPQRDRRGEYARRNARARAQGFRSYRQKRNALRNLPAGAPKGNTRRAARERERLAIHRHKQSKLPAHLRGQGYTSVYQYRKALKAARTATGVTGNHPDSLAMLRGIAAATHQSGNVTADQARLELDALLAGFTSARQRDDLVDHVRRNVNLPADIRDIQELAALINAAQRGQHPPDDPWTGPVLSPRDEARLDQLVLKLGYTADLPPLTGPGAAGKDTNYWKLVTTA